MGSGTDPPTARIIEGDARKLPGIADRSIDLVVTSPPYPMLPQWDELFAGLGANGYGEMHALLDDAWAACERVLVDGGLLAINVGDALRRVDGEFRLWPNHARILHAADRLGLSPLPYILWKKPTNKPNAFLGSGFLPPNAYVTLDCEYILLFRKGRLRRYPPRDPGRTASQLTRAQRDHWFSQVWDDVRGVPQGSPGVRTGAFPAEIPERLIRMFSCLGETVLDPFAGTGTTLWAATKLGRQAVGVEIDPALAEALRRRAKASTPAPGSGGVG
ncbi:MAG: site-specific DNA-methyltransferase [Thermoplasmata archaeon]|nr:site-specific DNA-methyltransferase [Thermoplasmata archaeon]